MINIWKDLVIGYGFYKREPERHLGDFGRAFVDGHESYYIMVREGVDCDLPEILCHELVHYYITKLVASMGIKIPAIFNRNGKPIGTNELPPEWAHSEPRCCSDRSCLTNGFCPNVNPKRGH